MARVRGWVVGRFVGAWPLTHTDGYFHRVCEFFKCGLLRPPASDTGPLSLGLDPPAHVTFTS